MKLFITGGTGQTGPAVVTELVNSGHEVMGLARSQRSRSILEGLGAQAVSGSVSDLDVLTDAARASDGVLHLAHMSGPSHTLDELVTSDVNAITALGEGLAGSGKPLVVTSGVLVTAPGVVSSEDDAPPADAMAAFRVEGEKATWAFTQRDVRTSVIRLAPTVHGPRDHGFIPMYIDVARRAGVAAYVGDGTNRWSAVHRQDAANLYRLAIEGAPAGTVLHGVGEVTVLFKDIAEAIGARLGIPTQSISADEAVAHFGSPFMAAGFASDSPASSEKTQRLLGWHPNHWTLLEDLERGDYLQ